jgi:hypothetical protein
MTTPGPSRSSVAGPWLRVLEESWQGTLARRRKSNLRVDLTGVTFIDAAGEACLAAMHRQGAEFVAADCLTKAIVAEITRGPRPDRACPNGQDESRPQRTRGVTRGLTR